MATTLRDIAARVGTSEATVSLVLNGRQYHRVSKAMRERIERVARELDYRPNRQAQLLAGGRTMTVALLVNRLLNQFFAEYLSVIESKLSARAFHAVPFETLSRADRAEELLGMIDQRLCDAIIALEYTGDPEKARERREGFPLVVRAEQFGRRADSTGAAGTVFVDYEPATRHLFETLRGSGARRIGLLSDTRHDLNLPGPQRSARAESQRQILTDLGLFSDPSQCVSLSQESDLGAWARATEALLTRDPAIDCLLVHNATVTPAVLHQIAALGRRVGEDIALATYDDPISAKWLGSGLTVVREPIETVAEALVQKTLDRIDGNAESTDARLEAELVVRGSSRLSR
jgi:DNA-binding LacI/PurR family transcriptional regulator